MTARRHPCKGATERPGVTALRRNVTWHFSTMRAPLEPMTRAFALALCGALTALPAAAEPLSDVVSGTLRPGWRQADGTHLAALHLDLAPGWKTYWRAPGDAGIAPQFDWSGSRNLAGVSVSWPVPRVFHQSGMRSVGYENELVLPIRVRPSGPGPVTLEAELSIGVCEEVCLPATLQVRGELPDGDAGPDPVIAAALAERPLTASEAGVRGVRCRIEAGDGTAIRLAAEIEMPRMGADEEVVVETGHPSVWVAEPDTRRSGNRLTAETRLEHVDGRAFAVDRSGVRITVMGDGQAVDIHGCSS